MDVKVDATMRWDGVVAVERKRRRRWVSFVGVVLPVLLVVALAAWFVRSYVVPPTISIPAPMTLAAAPPEAPPAPATETNGRAPSAAESSAEAPQTDPAPETAREPPPPLPMVQSLALAPPAVSFGPAPAVPTAPARDAAAAETIEPGIPIAGPIPLPPRRPRGSVARARGTVPLPPARPQQ